jgi:hypothetical protein
MKKILITNNSGNVGKSFISRELFYSNFKSNSKVIIEIESNNSSSESYKNVNTKKMEGKDLSTLFDNIFEHDEFVIDVGASQIIPFFTELQKSGGIDEDDIDLIIVPVTSDSKIQNDSIKTLSILNNLDLNKKVKVIFNRVDNISDIQTFIKKAKEIGYQVDPNLRILNYDAINKISELYLTVTELSQSKKDYKTLAKKAVLDKNLEEKEKYAKLYTLKKYADGIVKNLNVVYDLITNPKEIS